jgi:hypothetical protein
MSQLAELARTARARPSADAFHRVAASCLASAKAGDAPVVVALALAAFFHALGGRFDDRPVATGEIDAVAQKIEPLLDLLTEQGIWLSQGVAGRIESHLVELRDVLP